MPIKYVLMHAAGAEGAGGGAVSGDAGGGAAGGDTGAASGGASGAGAEGGGGKPLSMDETIRQTLARVNARGEGGDEDGAGSSGARPAGTGTQSRQPNGRFGTKVAADQSQQQAGTEQQLDENGQPIAQADDQQQQQAQQPTPYDKVAPGYKKDSAVAKAWANLPPDVRKEMHEREGAFHEGIKQYKQAAHFGSSIAEQLVPHAGLMKQHNRAPADVVKELGGVWATLVSGSPQEKAGLILQVLQDYSIDLASLTQAATQQPSQQTQDDPRLAAALQRLDKLEGSLTAAEEERQQREYASTVQNVTDFGNAVDKAGKPLRPHFQAVRETMAQLIEAGAAQNLDDAYEQACWSRKDIREALIRDQEAERVKREKAQAAAARTAAATNVTQRGAPPVAQPTGKMDDTIRNTLRQIQGRR